ncbi:family 78 glycoside hydrolase catalytic domain [Mucilaginibacter endophyticus]|uniref:family 78 glycoside hydrolase catalytic domain n=1 Tax=Mucilaginibacter endophyticus TaxID=2675003 RepID=UPI001ABF6195|nr:family 78 glycoside hydrolase catalytic domain [Mucilaginibacter endophyticus]
MRTPFLIGCLLFSWYTASAQIAVKNLLTENLKSPICIDAQNPRFSWQLTEKYNKAVIQQAYELQVDSSSLDNSNHSPLWSSGKINSDQSAYIPYSGKSLLSGHKYFWRVRIWDTRGVCSGWSEQAVWKMGLISPPDWHAQWIVPASNDTVNAPAPLLRNSFTLNKRVLEATAYISSHGFYEAQLNGHKIGDSFLTPGWTSYNKRLQYQAYDVTSLLTEGENAIGVTLGSGWYRSPLGPYTPRANFYGDKTALLMEIRIVFTDGSTKIISSDQNWKSSTGALRFAEIYNGCVIDTRLEKSGWTMPVFNDQDWRPVHVMPYTKNTLVATYNEPVKQHEVFKPIKIITTPRGEKVIDFGQNLVGWVKVTVKGNAGDSIKIAHAEVLDKLASSIQKICERQKPRISTY